MSRRQEISRQDIAFLYGDVPLFVRQLLPVQIALALAAQIEEDPIIRYFYDLYFHLLPGFQEILPHRSLFKKFGKTLLFVAFHVFACRHFPSHLSVHILFSRE